MLKYYTRACNFYYGNISKNLIKKKLAFPLCGNNQIAFDKIEIFIREKKKITSKIISIKNINKERKNIRKKIKLDIRNIISKRRKFYNPGIMGILNMTPDSFSDGGKFNSNIKSFKKISLMIKAGANIIDIGGESTRPGSLIISPKKEWNRVQKVIKKFKKKYPKILLSIDTRKSKVMVNSMKYKTDIINDVSSFNYDVNSIKALEGKNVWKIIHHMQGTPQTMQINPKYKNVLLDIYDFFENKIKTFKKQKKYSSKIILDPGIGFGKKLKHNLMLINKISLFHSLGFPLLIGTSRKRFIGQISGNFDTKERIGGTLSSVLFTLLQGVQLFRVHNVEEVKQGIVVYKKLLNQ
jgi:dihydropteroate synthase